MYLLVTTLWHNRKSDHSHTKKGGREFALGTQLEEWCLLQHNVEIYFLTSLIKLTYHWTLSYNWSVTYNLFLCFLGKRTFLQVWNHDLIFHGALCFGNFQNVQLRLHGVGILQSYCYSNFTWNQIFGKIRISINELITVLETLYFRFYSFSAFENCTNLQKSKFRPSKIAKNPIFDRFNSPKLDFT